MFSACHQIKSICNLTQTQLLPYCANCLHSGNGTRRVVSYNLSRPEGTVEHALCLLGHANSVNLCLLSTQIQMLGTE